MIEFEHIAGIGMTGRGEEPEPHPEPAFKIHDAVLLKDPPVRWGLPLDFDSAAVLKIKKNPIPIYVGGSPKWTAVVAYGDFWYEIREDSLTAAGQ